MVQQGDQADIDDNFARVRVNEQGRIVLPAGLRCQVGIEPGDTVVVQVKGDHLEILTDDAIIARLQALTAHVPRGTLVSEELIADRRAEALREMED